jgi:hypothetical protein
MHSSLAVAALVAALVAAVIAVAACYGFKHEKDHWGAGLFYPTYTPRAVEVAEHAAALAKAHGTAVAATPATPAFTDVFAGKSESAYAAGRCATMPLGSMGLTPLQCFLDQVADARAMSANYKWFLESGKVHPWGAPWPANSPAGIESAQRVKTVDDPLRAADAARDVADANLQKALANQSRYWREREQRFRADQARRAAEQLQRDPLFLAQQCGGAPQGVQGAQGVQGVQKVMYDNCVAGARSGRLATTAAYRYFLDTGKVAEFGQRLPNKYITAAENAVAVGSCQQLQPRSAADSCYSVVSAVA